MYALFLLLTCLLGSRSFKVTVKMGAPSKYRQGHSWLGSTSTTPGSQNAKGRNRNYDRSSGGSSSASDSEKSMGRPYYDSAQRGYPSNAQSKSFQMERIEEAYAKKDTALFVKLLKTCAARGTRVAVEVHPMVADLIEHNPPDANALCDLLWSAGRVGLRITVPAYRPLCHQLINAFLDLDVQNMDVRECTKGLGGLPRMGVRFSKLDPRTATHLQFKITKLMMNRIDEQGVANVIYCLGSIDAKWVQLLPETRSAVQRLFLTSVTSMAPQGVANSLYGFGLMHVNFDLMDRALQHRIQDAVVLSIGNMTAQGVSNTIYGLGQMSARWVCMKESFRTTLQAVVLDMLPQMTGQGVSNTFYGLAGMGMDWLEWRAAQATLLEDSLVKVVGTLNDQGAANIIYS
jgi:hypothetical protein